MLVCAWDGSGWVLRDNGLPYRKWWPWTAAIQPDVKNLQILLCPDSSSDAFIQSANVTARTEIYAPYALNYEYLGKYSGVDVDGYYLWSGINATSVNRPANTVEFIESTGVDYATANHAYVWTQPIGPVVEPPDASNAWKTDPGFASFGPGWGNQTDFTQYYDFPGYGGASFHHQGNFVLNVMPVGGANTTFCDGHAKFYRVGGLVNGTNFQPNQNASLVYQVTPSNYLWSPLN